MTCREFKNKIGDITLLAFIVSSRKTYIYKFKAKLVTFFMRKFIDSAIPKWDTVMFYGTGENTKLLDEEGRFNKFEEKADFLYHIARTKDQTATKCSIKETFITPDMSKLEGKKVKIHVLSDRKAS
jgi:hypothetical protein